MLALLFWLSLFFIFYGYFGYPLALKALSLFRARPVRQGDITPSVSLIITAHNEEARIEAKLQNTFLLVYPADRLEVIVASDCSTDRTDDIVRAHANRGVRLVRAAERRGKEYAQQCAVESASGEILVFSDVATILEPNGIAQIVRNFNDPSVGCVSSVDRFIDGAGHASGEGTYVRYEMALRNLEVRVHSLVGLSGSFFAARHTVCQPWTPDLQSDFSVLLNSIRQGMRGVADPAAVGIYQNIADERREFQRKVRTIVRGIAVLMKNLSLLHPGRYGLFAWQLFSHKLCRWLVPFFLIAAAAANLFLLADGFTYRLAFAGQVLFYWMAWEGGRNANAPAIARIPSYFVMANVAVLTAWYRYFFAGGAPITWEPSKR